MDRLLARLERGVLGRLAIPNLPAIITGGMAVAFVLAMVQRDLYALMWLDWGLVKQGQVWRLVSYLFIPQSNSPIWILFSLYWTWMVGSTLEREWGAFKFTAFYLLGALGTTVAAVVLGGVGNTYLHLSLLLAFATIFPDYEIRLFLILPLRMKWLGLFSAAFLVFGLVTADWDARGAIAAAMANYILFFTGHWIEYFRGRNLRVRQAARRHSMAAAMAEISTDRICAICGAKQSEGADIRVCSCERCNGVARNLCLEHARNH